MGKILIKNNIAFVDREGLEKIFDEPNLYDKLKDVSIWEILINETISDFSELEKPKMVKPIAINTHKSKCIYSIEDILNVNNMLKSFNRYNVSYRIIPDTDKPLIVNSCSSNISKDDMYVLIGGY